jgi:coenzyme F420-reducing hydrogenase beta subunit
VNSINKTGYNQCSGCGVCEVACTHSAVSIELDGDGFYKPVVNIDKCTGCGVCTVVCYKWLKEKIPFENTFLEKSICGAWSRNPETVSKSSSGGVGYELTKHFREKGYGICGVTFDAPNDVCKHIIADSDADLERIRTSKYLQSYTPDAFSRFKNGGKYLVVGTPCQIYGLRRLIQSKRREDDFILVDFFCHGTPSFNLWRKYKTYVCKKYHLDSKWESVNFRLKHPVSTWHSYAASISDVYGVKYEKASAFKEDLFFKFFLNDSCLNEACYECKLRLDHCFSDIRIADFWGNKYAGNDNGVTMVIANTGKGERILEEISGGLVTEKCNFDDLKKSQPVRYMSLPEKRKTVMEELKGNQSLDTIYRKHFRRSIFKRGLSFVRKRFFK